MLYSWQNANLIRGNSLYFNSEFKREKKNEKSFKKIYTNDKMLW